MSRGWNGWLATLLDAPGESVNESDGEGRGVDDGDGGGAVGLEWRVMRKKDGVYARCCQRDIARSLPFRARVKKAPACAKKDAIFACVYFRRNINSAGKKRDDDREAPRHR